MKRIHTKRALLLSSISLLLCISMLVGTTFAWFTDSVTSGRNQIVAGNLDVTLEYWDGSAYKEVTSATKLFDDTAYWEPGHTEVAYLKVGNAGSLALKYQLAVNVYNEITGINQAGEEFKLSDYLVFKVVDKEITSEADLYTREEAITAAGKAMGLTSFNSGDKALLNTGDANYVALIIYMPTTVGNEANHNGTAPSIELGTTVVATQATAEQDSFGSDYDENATYPAVIAGNKPSGEALALTAGNVKVTIPASAPEAPYTLKIDNANSETNADNETTLSLDINLYKGDEKVQPDGTTLYDVEIFIGTNAHIVGLTHNGSVIADWHYDPAAGYISFKTDSFSPFVITFMAKTTVVNSAAELQKAILDNADKENGPEHQTIILSNDIVLDGTSEMMFTDSNGAPLYLYHNDITLDLNGHSIVAEADVLKPGKNYANAVLLVRYSTLNIIGDGQIIAKNQSMPVYGWAHSTINIYGGTYVSNAYERNESAVYVNNATVTINVYGGDYSGYAFNVHDNCGTTPVIVLHEGIVCEKFFKNGTTDVIQSDINNGRIVAAEGCEFVTYTENGVEMLKVVKS